MILYLEKQLDECYRIYCLHQVRQDMPFMSRENYRVQFEEIWQKYTKLRKASRAFRIVPLYNDENKRKRKNKRTSIGASKNSYGAGCNRRDSRKRYRGQGR